MLQIVLDDLTGSSSTVKDILSSTVRVSISCDTCLTSTTSEEQWDVLPVPVCDSVSLSLDRFLQPESLAGVNAWFCPLCKCNRTSTRQVSFNRVGKAIIIHLKRYQAETGVVRKDTRVVSCLSAGSPILDLPVVVDEHVSFRRSFRLVGSINHSGSLDKGGHYWAYIFCPKLCKWLMCNDAAVTAACEDDISNASSYVLFYWCSDA